MAIYDEHCEIYACSGFLRLTLLSWCWLRLLFSTLIMVNAIEAREKVMSLRERLLTSNITYVCLVFQWKICQKFPKLVTQSNAQFVVCKICQMIEITCSVQQIFLYFSQDIFGHLHQDESCRCNLRIQKCFQELQMSSKYQIKEDFFLNSKSCG